MKNILFAVLFSTVLSLFANSQINSTSELLQNDLRNWFPVSVNLNDITQILTDENKSFRVFGVKMVPQETATKTAPFDTIVSVKLLRLSDGNYASVPSVQYLIYKGYCTGITYLDSFENLIKWKDVLKGSSRIENNHFVINNMLHFRFCLFPKTGIINILIDEGVQ